MTRHTRREILRAAGVTALGGAGAAASAVGENEDGAQGTWEAVDSPTDKPLNSAVDTAAGPYAVGGGGDVVGRTDDGWRTVVEYGPQARSRPLTGVDATDDGAAVWFVGGSGVIGEYNVETRTLTNYSAPKGKTSTWEDCAVRGTAGEDERLFFVNGSGELLVGVRQDSGAMEYRDVIKPGGGSTIPGVDFHSRSAGHVCSTSQFVAGTADGGESWNRIGIGFAGTSFFDVASASERDVNVAAGNGIVYRYDGFRWTPHVVDDERQAVRSVDRTPDSGIAAGDGGKVYERRSTGQWERIRTPVDTKLRGVARGSGVAVAVGNNGRIVERVEGADGGTDTGGTATPTPTATPTANGTAASDERTVVDADAAERVTLRLDPGLVDTYREGVWL
ncbi:WD40/YVTN/BNR-like repeat-containing protein [Halosimplex halobium]|uniref:WD40/YVTN/BNR-like repeat-containing protein n=1 Tax=Halosimplex halobium TaxID=3396618 RepID=UPI003F54D075